MQSKPKFTCKFCKKSYSRESTLVSHMCEPKRRYNQRGEPGVRIGMQTYITFYKISQGGAKPRTYENFASSSYYSAFVRFGNYCVETRVINPARYGEWLIKNNKKLDKWCSDTLYSEFLMQYIQTENPMDALQRAVKASFEWADETGEKAEDILRRGNTNKLCYMISSGRLSPWVLYTCDSGQRFLDSLSEEQVTIIWDYINPEIWQAKMITYKEEVNSVQEVLKAATW